MLLGVDDVIASIESAFKAASGVFEFRGATAVDRKGMPGKSGSPRDSAAGVTSAE